MHRNELLNLLEKYSPTDSTERQMWQETRVFVEENTRCFDRQLAIGHITASAWIVSPDRKQVLLMHHAKLHKWFQPGGHCDGDPDVVRVARKEATEETGLEVSPVHSGVFDVDVHQIPANPKEPEHTHFDIRFLFEADPLSNPIRNAESKEVRWIAVEDIELFNDSESILRMKRKTSPIV